MLLAALASPQQPLRLASDADLERQFITDRVRIDPALELAQRRFDAGDLDRAQYWLTMAREALVERRLTGLRSAPPPRIAPPADGVLVKPPRLLNPDVRPAYPAKALANRTGSLVRVVVQVAIDGAVGTIASDPLPADKEFSSAVMTAVRRWRFEPAIFVGKPVAVELEVFVEFSGQNGTVKVLLPGAPVLFGFLDVARRLAEAGKLAEAEDALTAAGSMIARHREAPGFVLARDTGRPGAPVVDPGLLEPVRILGGLPPYPQDAQRAGIEGEVALQLVVDREGQVSGVTPERGDPLLSAAAIDAARHWRFVPGAVGGVLTPMRVAASLRFAASSGRVTDDTDSLKNIDVPQKLHDVRPIYPLEAQKARLQGIVVIEATIGRDGRVRFVRVIRAVHPLLDDAAALAVKQWRYTPTLLKGEPVEVIMTVTTTFSLR